MTRTPRVDLDKLVRNILLDIALLKWFATHGRRDPADSAIALSRERAGQDEIAVLAFLDQHIGGAA